MHRSRTLLFAGLIALATAGLSTVSAQDKIAFVNLDKVFNEFHKTKTADSQLKAQAEEFNQERQAMVTEYEQMQEQFNKVREDAQNTGLSEEVRNQKRNEAEELLVEIREFESKIRRFDATRKKQLEDQSRRMRGRIVEEIQESINAYARTQQFMAVIDSSGNSLNGVAIVLFVNDRVDITNEMIEIVNKGNR